MLRCAVREDARICSQPIAQSKPACALRSRPQLRTIEIDRHACHPLPSSGCSFPATLAQAPGRAAGTSHLVTLRSTSVHPATPPAPPRPPHCPPVAAVLAARSRPSLQAPAPDTRPAPRRLICDADASLLAASPLPFLRVCLRRHRVHCCAAHGAGRLSGHAAALTLASRTPTSVLPRSRTGSFLACISLVVQD